MPQHPQQAGVGHNQNIQTSSNKQAPVAQGGWRLRSVSHTTVIWPAYEDDAASDSNLAIRVMLQADVVWSLLLPIMYLPLYNSHLTCIKHEVAQQQYAHQGQAAHQYQMTIALAHLCW